MINYDKDLSGYEPANGKQPRQFHIENIIRLLARIEEERHKAIKRVFEPDGRVTAFESLHAMQPSLEIVYSHVLRLQEWIKAAPDPDICGKS